MSPRLFVIVESWKTVSLALQLIVLQKQPAPYPIQIQLSIGLVDRTYILQKSKEKKIKYRNLFTSAFPLPFLYFHSFTSTHLPTLSYVYVFSSIDSLIPIHACALITPTLFPTTTCWITFIFIYLLDRAFCVLSCRLQLMRRIDTG